MTIDERLEALAQGLELLGSLHRDNDRRMGEIMDAMARNEERAARNEERAARNEERAAQMMDAITRLARIADAHEDRLDDHGDRLERLEDRPPGAHGEGGPRSS